MFGLSFDGLVGWVAAVLVVAVVAVLLSGWVSRRMPWRRGRWLAAAIGFLALSVTFPACSQDDREPPLGTCASRVGAFEWEATRSGVDGGDVQSLALAVALAAGTAPVALPVLRLRGQAREQREN